MMASIQFVFLQLAVLTQLLTLSVQWSTPDPAEFAVYAFSQCDVDQEDPQVYELQPDVTIRAIGKWSTAGDEAKDYNFAQIARYHTVNITFMGSGTASVIFPHDFADNDTFDAISTRDAENIPVPHDEFGFEIPARRGNLFNPAYRRYLLSWAKIQVDGGVDGVNFDEVNGGFSGGQKYGFNGNEGFDDFALADFNRYLIDKYLTFTVDSWASKFNMTPDNRINPSVAADDLENNFNYRKYLKAKGWSTDPFNSKNPLGGEWGRVTANRLYADDTSFTGTYIRRYWKEIVDELRLYAKESANRSILISSNGLWPYVDFNSVGMYPWNPDEQTSDYRGADYVPVRDGHLNGAKSLQTQYRYLKEQNRRIAGNVPLAVFIDWPSDMMTNYLNLSLSEKQDYWRIFGAEAYANGIFPSFHLKDTVGSPTAVEQGMLSFFKDYASFYKMHRSVFLSNDLDGMEPQVAAGNISAALLVQRNTGRRTVHLVNHNYSQGKVTVQSNFSVLVPLSSTNCPSSISIISPDTESRNLTTTCSPGKMSITVDLLKYYAVIILP